MRYSPERKEAVPKKMLPPNNRSMRELAEEYGISKASFYAWRRACEQANDWDRQQAERLKAERKVDRERHLERWSGPTRNWEPAFQPRPA